jgi:hypothetical protein
MSSLQSYTCSAFHETTNGITTLAIQSSIISQQQSHVFCYCRSTHSRDALKRASVAWLNGYKKHCELQPDSEHVYTYATKVRHTLSSKLAVLQSAPHSCEILRWLIVTVHTLDRLCCYSSILDSQILRMFVLLIC